MRDDGMGGAATRLKSDGRRAAASTKWAGGREQDAGKVKKKGMSEAARRKDVFRSKLQEAGGWHREGTGDSSHKLKVKP